MASGMLSLYLALHDHVHPYLDTQLQLVFWLTREGMSAPRRQHWAATYIPR